MSSKIPSLLFVTSVVILAHWSSGCATVHRLPAADIPTVSIADFVNNPKKFGFDAHGKKPPRMPKNGLVIKVPAGSTVPLRLALDVGVLTLQPGKNQLRFNRDVYLHIANRSMMISPDGERWVPMGDFDGAKKLFGLGGRGSLSVGFGMTKEQGAVVNLSVKQPGR